MKCCTKCFNDVEIINIVGNREKGDCDFCGSKNVYVCDISANDDLKESFKNLLEIYTPLKNLDKKFPKSKSDLIKNILSKDWSIFKLNSEKIYEFLTNLLPEKYQEESDLFDSPVGIRGSIQEEYLKNFSILGTASWEGFVKEIKSINRFHTTIINKEILKKVLEVAITSYKKDSKFYRARIRTEDRPYTEKEMGAPPSKKASAGRANPEGLSCLYLANSEKTTLHETRAGLYDRATVGIFILKEDINVIDLSAINKLSPFRVEDINLLAANLEHLNKIGNEISRPLRKHDSNLDYLPTQYICDYIKSIGYDGIQYKSTMSSDGVNFAIFDEKKLECIETINYDINSIEYKFKNIDE